MLCKHQVVQRTKDGLFYVHPCGQCLACRVNDTRSWYVRSHFELKKNDGRFFNYFLTLTYDEENIPNDGLCKKRHLKSFLNQINTVYKLNLRYFATSDYGNLTGRCHYHAILRSKSKITNDMVQHVWKKGFSLLKQLTKERVKYCLRYTVKKTPFDGSLDGWFRLISQGWGNNAVDYINNDDFFIIDGRQYGIPTYIQRKFCPIPKPVDKSKFFDRVYVTHRDVIGDDNSALCDLRSLQNERRKIGYVETIK